MYVCMYVCTYVCMYVCMNVLYVNVFDSELISSTTLTFHTVSGFCDYEVAKVPWGNAIWVESVGGTTSNNICPFSNDISVIRECSVDQGWNSTQYVTCQEKALQNVTVS